MKSLFILLFSIFFINFSSKTHAQSGWVYQSGTYESPLTSSYFINSNTGWIISIRWQNHANIFKTQDGGSNYANIYYGHNWNLLSLYFLNENTGWITLDSSYLYGMIKKTTDGGYSWFSQYIGYNQIIYSVQFLDQNTGWAVGEDNNNHNGIVLKTTNGGTNWVLQSMLPIGSLRDIKFFNYNTGFVSGGYYSSYYGKGLAKTINGGENWQILDTSSYYHDISFINPSTGWSIIGTNMGLNTIKKTTNGGINWVTQFGGGSGSFYLSSIQFVNRDTGWAVGVDYDTILSHPVIMVTRNGGMNWWYQNYPINYYGASLESVFFINEKTGWAVGNHGYVLKTTNGGGEMNNSVERQSKPVPDRYFLRQNYPNPFNPATVIEFDVHKASFVKLFVYDVIGRESAVLVNENLKAGSYKTEWNASSNSSGVYFYKMITDGFTDTKKMVLIK